MVAPEATRQSPGAFIRQSIRDQISNLDEGTDKDPAPRRISEVSARIAAGYRAFDSDHSAA